MPGEGAADVRGGLRRSQAVGNVPAGLGGRLLAGRAAGGGLGGRGPGTLQRPMLPERVPDRVPDRRRISAPEVRLRLRHPSRPLRARRGALPDRVAERRFRLVRDLLLLPAFRAHLPARFSDPAPAAAPLPGGLARGHGKGGRILSGCLEMILAATDTNVACVLRRSHRISGSGSAYAVGPRRNRRGGRGLRAPRSAPAGWLDAFVTATLSLARRGIFAGSLLAFARSLGGFGHLERRTSAPETAP